MFTVCLQSATEGRRRIAKRLGVHADEGTVILSPETIDEACRTYFLGSLAAA